MIGDDQMKVGASRAATWRQKLLRTDPRRISRPYRLSAFSRDTAFGQWGRRIDLARPPS